MASGKITMHGPTKMVKGLAILQHSLQRPNCMKYVWPTGFASHFFFIAIIVCALVSCNITNHCYNCILLESTTTNIDISTAKLHNCYLDSILNSVITRAITPNSIFTNKPTFRLLLATRFNDTKVVL